jgi:hypothetical protein
VCHANCDDVPTDLFLQEVLEAGRQDLAIVGCAEQARFGVEQLA